MTRDSVVAIGLVELKLMPTDIQGVIIAEHRSIEDARGSFARLFCVDALRSILDGKNIVQINHSRTSQVGAIRGIHFQHPPHAEMKIIRCLKGCVWDVAVDLRRGSPTFLHWHAQELNEGRPQMMIIPEGCAHGFQVLAADSELLYLHSAAYAPGAEGGIYYNDPLLSIDWPLDVTDISSRDQLHGLLLETFQGLDI